MSHRLIAALDAVQRATFDLTGGRLILLDLKRERPEPEPRKWLPCSTCGVLVNGAHTCAPKPKRKRKPRLPQNVLSIRKAGAR